MDRHWLLTSTFYGNWLPGDPRGFVSRVRDVRPDDEISDPTTDASRHVHDIPGTPYDEDIPGLHGAAETKLKCAPIRVNLEQATALAGQFRETAAHRGWRLLAYAIMPNHIHIVVGVNGDPPPQKILGDFKADGSRPLSASWGKPPSETWWTYGGSKRKLSDDRAIRAAIEYVRNQFGALVVWVDEEYLRE